MIALFRVDVLMVAYVTDALVWLIDASDVPLMLGHSIC
jgi:hypothetical protein